MKARIADVCQQFQPHALMQIWSAVNILFFLKKYSTILVIRQSSMEEEDSFSRLQLIGHKAQFGIFLV